VLRPAFSRLDCEMNAIERLYEDELVSSRYRPIPVSGLRKGQVKAMDPDIEPTRSESVTPPGSSPDRIHRPNQQVEERFSKTLQEQLDQELNIRVEERSRERVRIAGELHDTLFQGSFAASMLLHNVVKAMPVHSPEQHSLGNVLRLIHRVLEEGRSVLRGLRAPEFAPSSIERELSGFLEQFSTGVVRCQVSVAGHSRQLKPAIQEQINLIGREALVNALLHSEASCIEAEVEYLPGRLRVVVRDNGRGVDSLVARTQTDAHWGLVGMRDRAESIGAKLTIWSRPGAGTEVEISFSGQAFADACS
jgi:signal transduction histidine kinase